MNQTVQLSERIRGRYEQVPPILRLEFDHVFREPLDELRVQVGGGSIGWRVQAEVGPMDNFPRPSDFVPRTLEVPVSWQAVEHPALFPTMNGQLRIRDAGHETIELRLTGEYTPPLGAIGALGDRFVGHQAVTVSLRGYLLDVAHRLDAKLAEHRAALASGPSRAHRERSPRSTPHEPASPPGRATADGADGGEQRPGPRADSRASDG
jgi:hypothetical protein